MDNTIQPLKDSGYVDTPEKKARAALWETPNRKSFPARYYDMPSLS